MKGRTAIVSSAQVLFALRVFLLLLGVTFLVLDSLYLNFISYVLTRDHLDPDQYQIIIESRSHTFGLLFSADFAAILMFTLLLVKRPRFSNMALHTACRVLFSLGLAALVMYQPVEEMIIVAKAVDRMNEIRSAKGFEKSPLDFSALYMCGDKPNPNEIGYDPAVPGSHQAAMDELLIDWQACNVKRSRSIMTFFMGVGILFELAMAFKAKEFRVKMGEEESESKKLDRAGFVRYDEKSGLVA